jgi:hypothetical protein
VNYSSGVWGIGSMGVAQLLPTDRFLWLVARVLLDLAGALFLLYLLAVVLVTGRALAAPPSALPGRRTGVLPGGPAAALPGGGGPP